jgi:alkylresorcinol/alkylpyrone synthase
MPFLIGIDTAFPANYYSQDKLIEELSHLWKGKIRNIDRIKKLHENVQVRGRSLACELTRYFSFENFDEKNDEFLKTSVNLMENAVNKILTRYKISPADISSIWSNTVTGFAIPGLEARLMNRIDFDSKTKRVPIMGLGCMAGAAGINRVADYLKGHPSEAVLFISVELCSLTVQMQDLSPANIVSTGLFGDGCAVVLMVGDKHALREQATLEFIDSRSEFFKDSERVMGWQVGEKGLSIILSRGVPEITEQKLPGPLGEFLGQNNIQQRDISTYLAHPGGPKVLWAMEKVFDLPQGGLKHSWESLSENGNMSSVSVLDIMERTFKNDRQKTGEYALSVAMGPAFSAEFGLFKWV